MRKEDSFKRHSHLKSVSGYHQIRKRHTPDDSLKSDQTEYIRLRILIIGFFLIILYAVIGGRAIYLQVFQGSWLSEKAADEYEKSLTLQGKRGTIYDIKYRELAVSNDVTSIAAYPVQIQYPIEIAERLADALRIDEVLLRQRLSSRRTFTWIKRQVTPKEEDVIRNFQFTGIDFIPEHSRFYPNKTLAAQVIGFTGIDGRGLEGIEFYYNTYLTGAAGNLRMFKDALGRGFARGPEIGDTVLSKNGVLAIEKKVAPNYSGNNLILTLDRTVQYIAEKALEETVKNFSAESGIAIVMVPGTGAILALAHYPFFNPNSFSRFRRELWRNRSITDPFEPGSTMKIFSAAAALESGACKPDTIFFCENGKYKIGDDVVHDTRAHKWLTLEDIIKYSSNIGAVKIGEMIGAETLYNTLYAFGFGEKTGIDCPGETSGSLLLYKQWSKIDAGAISFGQAISVSAIQLVTAVSAIANHGILMKPYVVHAITDQNGKPVKEFEPCKVRQVVSRKTADTVKKMMQTVTETGGTGVNAALRGYSVCGKTGTAQKVNKRKGEYADGRYISSFIGFVPAEVPALAIAVIIDEPKGNYYGGVVAAPAFREIAYETLNYLNIPPHIKTDNKLTASR